MSCWHTALGAKFAWSNPLVVDWVMVCSKDVQGLTNACTRIVLQHHNACLLTIAILNQLYVRLAAFACAHALFELPQQASGHLSKALRQLQKALGQVQTASRPVQMGSQQM